MPDLSADDIARIASDAVREQSMPLEIAGVVLRGDTDYVEILMNIDQCAIEPCQMAIGVFRDKTEAALRREIVNRIRDHLNKYGPVPRA
jgi:hypothetical protein